MNTDRYRFKLGDFDCLAILDSTGSYNSDVFFPNVSHHLLQAENINPDAIDNFRTCLAVDTSIGWVLLDTSLGFLNEDAKLAQILEEENIKPRHIIITHLDADHYGGLINSQQKPAFPDTEVHICRDAWQLFTSEEHRPETREHLLLVKEQVTTVDCDGEVLPGFRMIPFPGHREYHVGIEVVSNGAKLLFAADTVCHPLHIKHLEWHFGGDSDHELACESRIKMAQMASESGCLVLAYHFEFPGLGHVIQEGDGWQWQPLEV